MQMDSFSGGRQIKLSAQNLGVLYYKLESIPGALKHSNMTFLFIKK